MPPRANPHFPQLTTPSPFFVEQRGQVQPLATQPTRPANVAITAIPLVAGLSIRSMSRAHLAAPSAA
jgi:hypothetical protein